MRFDPIIHHRRSIRLKGYNYSQDGAYFVNLVSRDRTRRFGEVIDGEVLLNRYGQIVDQTWRWLEDHYPHVSLDAYILMPDHLHGIIVLNGDRRGVSRNAPTLDGVREREHQKPLGQIIGAFKTVSTKRVNLTNGGVTGPLWQRNYWERVIRDDKELVFVREYIRNNPTRWTHHLTRTW